MNHNISCCCLHIVCARVSESGGLLFRPPPGPSRGGYFVIERGKDMAGKTTAKKTVKKAKPAAKKTTTKRAAKR